MGGGELFARVLPVRVRDESQKFWKWQQAGID